MATIPIGVQFYHEMGRLGLLDNAMELLDGVIVRKIPKSPLHVTIVHRLARFLTAALKPGQLLLRDDPITTARSEPEPDLAVTQGREEDFFDHHPVTALLVIEVAVSSVEIDRRKAPIYAEAGVAEYWLVEPEVSRVTAYRTPVDGGYETEQVYEADSKLISTALPDLTIKLTELFQR